MAILRPPANVLFTTPSNTTVGLNVNCADNRSSRWAWASYYVSTIGTPNAVTTSSYVADPGNVFVSGTDTSTGTNTQIVLRTMFAYIADAPFNIQGETNFSTSFVSSVDTLHSTTFEIYTRLYYPNGTLHSEYFNESVVLTNSSPSSRTASGVRRFNAILPATTCPLVVFTWLKQAGTIPSPLTSKTVSGDIKIRLGITPAEIVVERDGIDVPLNSTSNFGNVFANDTIQRSFEIKNYGSVNLVISSFLVASGGAGAFSVASPPSSIIAGYGSSSFTIRFNPKTAGTYQDTVLMVNSDSNENPFVINLTGTADPSGEISVEQPAGTNIPNNGTKDFGQVASGLNKVLIFTIKNTASSGLSLTGSPRVSIVGSDRFIVTASPSSYVPGNSSTVFSVGFYPNGPATFSATMSIINSDGDENPFTITLTGTGT